MANIIKYAINNLLLKSGISREVLELAFIKKNYNTLNTFINLEKEIEDIVIKQIILPDCNIYGGTEVLINTSTVPIINESRTEKTIRIPLEYTNGKKFNSIRNVCYYSIQGGYNAASTSYGMMSSNFNNPIISLTSQLLSSVDTIFKPSTAKCDLINRDNSVIRMYDTGLFSSTIFYIRGSLEYDESLSELPLAMYDSFYKLFVFAVKAYIYNKLIVPLDKGYIQGGYEIGVIKEIVSEFKDADSNYLDYLENTWKKQQFMSDPVNMSRFLTGMFR